MSHEYVIVLTTLPADADCAAFARDLVEERLAACVNLSAPMESIYRWDGNVENEAERQLVIKTSRDRVVALWDRVRELHPYRHAGIPGDPDRRWQRRLSPLGSGIDDRRVTTRLP